jgi:hypothetical protein
VWLQRPGDWRMQVLLFFPVVLITGAHSIVFGHSRYHLPLMPIMGIWAAALLADRLSHVQVSTRWVLAGATASVLLLCSIWIRQVAFVDGARIAAVLRYAGL